MFTSFCTCCSLTCHCWRQITSYKCIDPIKKKITDKSINKCDTKSKIPYCRQDPFTCEDCDRYASIWLLYLGSSSDDKPYGFALTMNKHDSTDQNGPPIQSNVVYRWRLWGYSVQDARITGPPMDKGSQKSQSQLKYWSKRYFGNARQALIKRERSSRIYSWAASIFTAMAPRETRGILYDG